MSWCSVDVTLWTLSACVSVGVLWMWQYEGQPVWQYICHKPSVFCSLFIVNQHGYCLRNYNLKQKQTKLLFNNVFHCLEVSSCLLTCTIKRKPKKKKKGMPWPGFEPGLSRPQREVLTTRLSRLTINTAQFNNRLTNPLLLDLACSWRLVLLQAYCFSNRF